MGGRGNGISWHFFFKASNPKNKTMREELQSTCHSCPAKGSKPGSDSSGLFFFSTSPSLSTEYPSCALKLKKGKKKLQRKLMGKCLLRKKLTMAFYDLEPLALRMWFIYKYSGGESTGNLLLEWTEHHHQSCTPTGAVYLIWDGQKRNVLLCRNINILTGVCLW